jgi:hypothetical protein
MQLDYYSEYWYQKIYIDYVPDDTITSTVQELRYIILLLLFLFCSFKGNTEPRVCVRNVPNNETPYIRKRVN